MPSQTETPVQEAVTLVTIAAILAGAGCYIGASRGLPVLTDALAYVAELVYARIPALSVLKSPQVPLLVSSFAIVLPFWILGVCCSGVIAQGFSSGQVAQMERQTRKLKKNRARIKSRQRRADDFTAY